MIAVNFADLTKGFELLVLGWGGVFLVLFIIYLTAKALSKFFPIKK